MLSSDSNLPFVDKAMIEDVPQIIELIREYSDKEILLPRSEKEIKNQLSLTWVARSQGQIVAVGNLISFDPTLYEVRGLVVHSDYRGLHLGYDIVNKMILYLKQIENYKAITLFALTYEPKFFESCNFNIVDKIKFPAKIYEVCQFCTKQDDCKEIAVKLNWELFEKKEHHQLEEGHKLKLDFSKIKDIKSLVIPGIAQDILTREVLIVGYVNQEAFDYAIENKVATFFSTSRNKLWIKGQTSGNTLKLKELKVNCEQNSVLYLVEMVGKGSCHTLNKEKVHRKSCYYRKVNIDQENLSLDFLEK